MILITQHAIDLVPLATTQQTLLYMMLLMQHFSQTLPLMKEKTIYSSILLVMIFY